VLTLAPNERARLAEVLLESLHDTHFPKIETAWQREIEERVAAWDQSEARFYTAEEVFAAAKLQGS